MTQRIHCCACSFWECATPENVLSPGFCRRYAPRPIQGGGRSEWVVTYRNDWCGEAQPAKISRAQEGPNLDDAKQAIEYIKAYPTLFINEGAQGLVIKMLKDRFGL